MRTQLAAAASALVLSLMAASPSFAHGYGQYSGMMDGYCPMMGMMGPGMMGPGMMAQGMQGQGMQGQGMQGSGMMDQGTAGQDTQGSGMMDQGTAGQGMQGQGMMGQGMQGWHPSMDAMAIGHLAFLQAELGITDAQMAAWNDYAGAVKDQATAMEGMHKTMMSAMHSGDITARMNAHINAMESMVGAMKAMEPKVEALYAVLNDEQKQKANMLIGMGCGMM
jgi:hypothetical protein